MNAENCTRHVLPVIDIRCLRHEYLRKADMFSCVEEVVDVLCVLEVETSLQGYIFFILPPPPPPPGRFWLVGGKI